MSGMLQYLSFGGAEWGCMTQLFFDNASTLLGVLAAVFNMTAFGVPLNIINEVVYDKILPGLGITLILGNTYYTYLAMRRSQKEGRAFTAQPYGINTPGAFAFVYNIIYTVYFSGTGTPTENFLKAYNVALSANFISGIISVVLGAFGSQLVRVVPPGALLVPVAGIGFAFLGLEQATTPFAAPLVGFMTVTTLFLGWYADVRISFKGFKIPEALQVILVGVILGWATGLNKGSSVKDAADLVQWYGPAWTGKELFENFSDTKDYMGIIFPIAISAVGTSLMALVSAKAAGDTYPVTESMVADGIGTMIASLFGSPFGTVMYFGHPAYKRSGAKTGYSLLNGVIYLFLSWFGLVALIRSIVNQPTIGPIVLFVGLMLLEECLRLLPSRHCVAFLFGLFPSIADWVTNISSRAPLLGFADDGSAYNTNLPDLTDGWWGILGLKRGAILVSMCWTAMLVYVVDRKWWQAGLWGIISALFSAVGIIHVPEAGFDSFDDTVSDLCTPVMDETGATTTASCWDHADQWHYMTAYLMLAVVFGALEVLRNAGIGNLKEPIEDDTASVLGDWYGSGTAPQEGNAASKASMVSADKKKASAGKQPEPSAPTAIFSTA